MPVAEHAVHYLEIVTPEARAVADLYAKAHGLRFAPEAPELGNALVATLSDGSLCGVRAPLHDQERPVVRPYRRVADLAAAVKRVAALGATVALDPTEIPGRGTIAIYLLGGIEHGVWQV